MFCQLGIKEKEIVHYHYLLYDFLKEEPLVNNNQPLVHSIPILDPWLLFYYHC